MYTIITTDRTKLDHQIQKKINNGMELVEIKTVYTAYLQEDKNKVNFSQCKLCLHSNVCSKKPQNFCVDYNVTTGENYYDNN